jgi:prepilin-type N-terminal cleavage/methylation domain-containing protein
MSGRCAPTLPEPAPLLPDGARNGITLVEVVVALLLLAVGAMALAAGIGAGEKARREAVSGGLAQAVAEGWLETWRAEPWPALSSGVREVRWGAWRGWLGWQVTSLAPCLIEGRVEAGPVDRAASVVLVSRRFREGASGC